MKKKEKLRKKKINSVRTTLLIYVDKEIETKLKFQRQMNINGYNPLVIFKHYTEMNNTITFTNPITTYSTYNNELNNSNSSSSYSLFQTRKKICTNLLRKLSNNEGEMIFNKKRHVSQMKLNLYSKPSYESGFIYNDSLKQKDNDKRYELYIKSCKYLIELAETLFPNAPSVRREIDGALFSFRPNYANDEQVNNNSSENISLSQEEHEDYFVPYKQELDLVPKEFQFKLGDSASGSASNSSIRFHHFDSFSSFDL